MTELAMAIITIFAGTLGDDEEVARDVATQLGYAFIGRELLSAASRRCEVPEAKLNDIVEKEPHWWKGWQENLRPYRIALQAAMSEAALGGKAVQDIFSIGTLVAREAILFACR